MKFPTSLTRIAALLATSGLASGFNYYASSAVHIDYETGIKRSVRKDVCAGGLKRDCDREAATLLGSLDSMPSVEAFLSVKEFLRRGSHKYCASRACLSSELKSDLCEKAHSIKPQFYEEISTCFPSLPHEKYCHVSYECPHPNESGFPTDIYCITHECNNQSLDKPKMCVRSGTTVGTIGVDDGPNVCQPCCSKSCYHTAHSCKNSENNSDLVCGKITCLPA